MPLQLSRKLTAQERIDRSIEMAFETGKEEGFAAALAMLREPSRTLLNRVTEAVDAATNGAADDYEEWCSSKMADAAAGAALAAAADAMGEPGTKKAGAE